MITTLFMAVCIGISISFVLIILYILAENEYKKAVEDEKQFKKQREDLNKKIHDALLRAIDIELRKKLQVNKKYPIIVEQSLKAFGIDSNSTIHFEQLRKRYIELIKKNHPDINSNGEDMTKLINQHYMILKNNRKLFL